MPTDLPARTAAPEAAPGDPIRYVARQLIERAAKADDMDLGGLAIALGGIAADVDRRLSRRRTTWPAAAPLQQAADKLRDRSYFERTGEPDTEAAHDVALADLLDEAANALSWLAPFRPRDGGYGLWEAASRVAAAVNGTAPTASAVPARTGE